MQTVIEPLTVVYRETFKIPCAHKECKKPLVVVIERIKGGKTASIEVTHET